MRKVIWSFIQEAVQHGVHGDGWILTVKLAFFVALDFVRFVGESRPASRRYTLTGTMSRAVGTLFAKLEKEKNITDIVLKERLGKWSKTGKS